jgi:2-iminobutanoate/2-iminopropanoate deaminase
MPAERSSPRDGTHRKNRLHGPVALVLLVAAVGTGCRFTPVPEDPPQEEAPPDARLEHIVPEGVARLPVFTPAVRVGDLVFLSGAIGTPPTGELRVVEGGIGPETRATMDNLQRVLGAAGLGLEDLVKCTVFLADIADYAAMNEVYVTYFDGMEPPARSAMAGSGLALGARVEIECIAAAR